eukprot:1179487-Prorocentrum_minimum.AAC.2
MLTLTLAGSRLLEEARAALAEVSAAAYGVWAAAAAAALGRELAGALLADEQLNATTAPRGWEETVIRQDGVRKSTIKRARPERNPPAPNVDHSGR